MPKGSPVRECVKIPVVRPPCARQLVVGFVVVPQHVPRAVRVAPPFEVTFAPRVALVVVIEVAVGEVTVGTEIRVHEFEFRLHVPFEQV